MTSTQRLISELAEVHGVDEDTIVRAAVVDFALGKGRAAQAQALQAVDNLDATQPPRAFKLEHIRATLHELLERELEAKLLHVEDSARAKRFDLDSPHLATALGICGAIDGVKAAWVAVRCGKDPIETLDRYSNRYLPRLGNEGIPLACDEISAVVRRWRELDAAHGDENRHSTAEIMTKNVTGANPL